MKVIDTIYRVGIILIVLTSLSFGKSNSIEKYSRILVEDTDDISNCTNRDQLDIQRTHMRLSADLLSIVSENKSEFELRNEITAVIEKMYQNFCSGDTLTFEGKIGTIEKVENSSNFRLRIDDMVSSNQKEYLFNYESTVPIFRGVGPKLGAELSSGDLVLFKFSIGSFFEPRNRKQVVDLIVNKDAGSFPVDRMWDGVDDTFPQGEYYIFPIHINVTEINSLAELFTQYKDQEVNEKRDRSSNNDLTAKEYYENALKLEEKQDFEGAVDLLNKAIKLNPDFAKAYEARSDMKYYLQDLNGALNDIQTALKLDPKSKEAYVSRALLKLELGSYVEDICKDLKKAKELGSNAPLIDWERCQN